MKTGQKKGLKKQFDEKEVSRFFKEIGLEKEEDRDRFKNFGTSDTKLDYEILFSNNTK